MVQFYSRITATCVYILCAIKSAQTPGDSMNERYPQFPVLNSPVNSYLWLILALRNC